ncbi:MAG: sulfotransferase [Aquisalinus sp.]|nr:sulfotransferase [Aquisalinus sp.]
MSRYPNLSGKTMILGIGAPRAGTSWLFEYLKTYEDIACSPLKELHYFDTLYVPHLSRNWERDLELATIEAFLAKPHLNKSLIPRLKRQQRYREALIDRLRMSYCSTGYLDHFERLCNDQHRFFCEITPAYMMLKAEHFQEIINLFDWHDIDLKIVFLMRDPVSRHWSQLKYQEIRGKILDANEELEKSFSSRVLEERTRYDRTIIELEKVFPRSRLYYGFYENLFSQETITELQEFLGLSARSASFDQIINRSVRSKSIPEQTKVRLKEHYADVYRFCVNRFGDELPSAWES